MHHSEYQILLCRLHRAVQALARYRVRDVLSPTHLEIRARAEASYDAPSGAEGWEPFSIDQEWGEAGQWSHFRAVFDIPDTWSREDHAIDWHFEHMPRYHESEQYVHFLAGPEGQLFVNGPCAGAIDRMRLAAFKTGRGHKSPTASMS